MERDDQHLHESGGFTFTTTDPYNGTEVITLTIPATVENNNTQLRCRATGNPGPVISEPITLTIAGILFHGQQ